MQTLFIDLLKKNREEADAAYLYRAATNRCLNYLRDKKKRAELLARENMEIVYPRRTLIDDRVVGLQLLAELTAKLDKKSAEILVYRYIDDLTQNEIADLMRLNRKTVNRRLAKIEKLAKRIWNKDKESRP